MDGQRTFGLCCCIIIGIFTWFADPESSFEIQNPSPANSHYNLLAQGFQAGHLYMKIEAPPEFFKVPDPYDPIYITQYPELLDTSYYKGKFYLYFGLTPLLLFWPYAVLTGHYLSDRDAIAIFFAIGLLVVWELLQTIRRLYFAETSFLSLAPGIFTLGLALGLTQSGILINDVASVSAFAFAMLALYAIWRAMHDAKCKTAWLLLASLAYGLAIGSRPSFLFGAIILFIPVAQAWRVTTDPNSRRQVVWLFAAVIVPITLIGVGLMVYNDLRFESPFEFGRRYQLAGDYRSPSAQQLSLHYVWFNFQYYFLEPMRWKCHLPFLQTIPLPPRPSGYTTGPIDHYGGLPGNYPLILFVFALPLAWLDRPVETASALRWVTLALFLLFAACAGTDCLFMTAATRYAWDFLPALILLSFIGFLGVERVLVPFPNWRRMARLCWYALLVYSLIFNVLANVKTRAFHNYLAGSFLDYHDGQFNESVEYLQKAVAVEPDSTTYHLALGDAYFFAHQPRKAMDEVQTTLKINPNCAEAEWYAGYYLLSMAQPKEAFMHFEKALKDDPVLVQTQFIGGNLNVAWYMATNPDPTKRNGPLAVTLAEDACRQTLYKQTRAIEILGAAYADAGQFDNAIATAQKAIALARQNGETNLLEKNQQLLDLYLEHQPYHETDAKWGN